MKFKYIIILFLIVLSGLSAKNFAQSFSQQKKIERQFHVNKITTVDIQNKYGKVHVIEWNNDSVKFQIDVMVISKDEKKLKGMINSVDFQFANTNYYLNAKTIFNSEKNVFSDFMKLSETILSLDNKIVVDYTVWLPSYVGLKINNKYGDVYTENLKNNLNLYLSNGNFKAGDLEGNCDIELIFCNSARVNSFNTAKLNLSYSEMDVKKIDQGTLLCKSTVLNILDANVINAQSKRDKVQIDNVNFFYGDSYFSNIKIGQLNSEISMDMKYGFMKVESIAQNFSLINLVSSFADVELYFKRNSDFLIDIAHKNTKVSFLGNTPKVTDKTMPDHTVLISGFQGQPSQNSTLKVKTENGELKIFQK